MRTILIALLLAACTVDDPGSISSSTAAPTGSSDDAPDDEVSGSFVVDPTSVGVDLGSSTGTTDGSTTGSPDETGSSSNPPIPPDPEVGDLRVFITGRDRVYPADALGGGESQLAGADAACAELAEEAGLEGRWKAWLSTAETWPALRFPPAPARYIQMDGGVAAWSWADLLAGEGATVDVDPFGFDIHKDEEPFLGPLSLWTGTGPAGAPSTLGHCEGWTSTYGLAADGIAGSWSATWTESGLPAYCRDELGLYCFEQAPGCRREACTGARAACFSLGLLSPELCPAGCEDDPCGACSTALAACDWAGRACPATRELCGQAAVSCGCS